MHRLTLISLRYPQMVCKISVIILCLLSVLISGKSFATRYAGDFEEFGASARAFGLGGAYTAVVSDPSTIYYNPGASTQLSAPEVILLHSENFESGIVKNNFFAYVQPQNNQAIGLAILTNRIPDIKITNLRYPDLPPSETNPPIVERIVNASDWILYLNYARIINPNFSLGGNFKFIYRSVGIGSCYGIGIDFGTLFEIQPDFKFGIKLTNITTSPLFWTTKTREIISPKIIFGIAKFFAITTSTIQLTSDLESNFDKFNMNTNLGFEYLYKNVLGLRIGLYHWNPTFGVGLTFKRFFLDYAYLSRYHQEDLGASQKFSGGIRF